MQNVLTELRITLFENEVYSILIETERVANTIGFYGKVSELWVGILQHHAITIEILRCQLFIFLPVVGTDTDTNLPLTKVRQIDRRVGWNLLMHAHLPVALNPQLHSLQMLASP